MNITNDFLLSALTLDNDPVASDNFDTWLAERSSRNKFRVDIIPFDKLRKWYFEDTTGNIRHDSGKFFSIEGLSVETNFGSIQEWDQPAIFQPEVGILGVITKVINKTRYFLMQAKMEPGNINILQISPTVQATRSNYTQVHEGKLPAYLEYFIDSSKSKIIIDTLQPEQSGRFFRKRNRNMVVEVTSDIVVFEDFIWLTAGQIKKALMSDNIINMDARSVLATIPFFQNNTGHHGNFSFIFKNSNLTSYAGELFRSANSFDDSPYSMNDINAWMARLKKKYYLTIKRIPLREVINWKITERSIEHESGRYFKVIAVDVHAGNREVINWSQPMIRDSNIGLIGYIVKSIRGILHFLVQAKVEPGCIDQFDLSPTISCSDFRRVAQLKSKPHFCEYFVNPNPATILNSAIQSEEGGRFHHFQNRNMIIRVDENELRHPPENYKWMTLCQMMELMKKGYLNIESRSLISALSMTRS